MDEFDRLVDGAVREARAADDALALDVHLLIHVLSHPSPLIDRLGEAGLTASRVRAEYGAMGYPVKIQTSRGIAPTTRTVVDRARSFAAGADGDALAAIIAAIVWEPNQPATALLRRLGVTPDTIVRILREGGHFVPDGPPPLSIVWGAPARVSTDFAAAIYDRLVAHMLSMGSTVVVADQGDGSTLMVAPEGVDLATAIESAKQG